MVGERKLLTWTLNAGTANYENDLEQYGNKIYALGVHEFQVEYDGEIYVRRAIPSSYNGSNYGTYRYGADKNGDGIGDTFIDNADPAKNPMGKAWMSWSFWQAIEKGMRRWNHIRHYISFILFGSSRVTKMMDNQAYQDAFIENCKAVIDTVMGISPNSGTPNAPYVRGIEIDFEASMSDKSLNNRVGDNVKYMNILKRVKEEICIPRGLALQVNAYAMWGKDTPFYYRFHDYELFANTADINGDPVIDELQIMTYDFAWNGSAPGASTPLWWFDNVSTWAKQTFGAPGAKLTLNNVFFGSAGYGHRWGIYHDDFMYGATLTYRQFVDWQNGLYKHNRNTKVISSDGVNNIFEWANQDFLCFAGIEDQESKNQILQQHVYDYFKARYGTSSIINGGKSMVISSYNGGEYATTYSRLQRSLFTNIVAETFAPSAKSVTPGKGAQITEYLDIQNTPVTIREKDKTERVKTGIKGYQVYPDKWVPQTIEGSGLVCTKVGSGRVTYTLDVPTAGSYKLIALTSFIWYNQAKIAGYLNGSDPVTIQAFADYYPLHFKASHWFDCGTKDFNSGENTIVLDGDLGDPGTIIYGFIVCEDFKNNFAGGEITFKSTVSKFKKKDGTLAPIPDNLSFTSKALRQPPLPLMMWEDRFDHYRRGKDAEGNIVYKDYADVTDTTYYTSYEEKEDKRGTGNILSYDQTFCYNPEKLTYEIGYSTGVWAIKKDQLNGKDDSAYAYWNDTGSGRLLVNYEFRSNVQVEAEFRVQRSGKIGIVFGGSSSKDGYRLVADFSAGLYGTLSLISEVINEDKSITTTVIQSESLPANIKVGDRTKLKVILHNNKGYMYIGFSNIKAFGAKAFDLSRASGGVAGVYADNVEARVYMLKVSTTDKWDLMEKFTIEATLPNGNKYSNTFGNIQRLPEYTIDSRFGYLNYSGINELNTRVLLPEDPTDPETEYFREDISLDYDFFINEVPGFDGTADILVTLDDPGIWYAYLYVVDRAGGSVTWVGDSHSFLDSLNRASNEVGAKGIGMWTMGQEEPRVFDTIPEIVPYHD